MSGPMKLRGFAQGLYEISATKKEKLGLLRIDQYGRKFRYCKAGATALSAGKLGVRGAIDTSFVNEAITAAVPIGTQMLELTVTGMVAACAENDLVGGLFVVNDATGEGQAYAIDSNTAVAISGTSIVITLEEKIKVALDTTSEFTLVTPPQLGVVESTTMYLPVGIPLVAVTASYYYWAQTGGLGVCLIDGNIADGSMLQQSNGTAGALELYAAATIVFPPIAVAYGQTTVTTEYNPIWLMID